MVERVVIIKRKVVPRGACKFKGAFTGVWNRHVGAAFINSLLDIPYCLERVHIKCDELVVN
ncbi:MAG: hypothetical protein CL699_07775 [Chloroflexi bacterium]|nr:hypothetical protein [Chloroflexota bacterium]